MIRRAPHEPMQKKLRGGMAKLRLKQVVKDLIKSKDMQNKLAKSRKEKAVAFRAELFAYDATQKVVQQMLCQLESCLIEGRSPLERAQQVLSQLINYPAYQTHSTINSSSALAGGFETTACD